MNQPITYEELVAQLKAEIQTARIQASLSVNVYLLVIYWKIGKTILQHQQAAGWVAKIIDSLSHDLKSEFPDMKGISPRNLKYMRAFAEAYPQFVQQAAAQIAKKVQQPVGQIGQQVVDQSKNQIVQEALAQTAENISQTEGQIGQQAVDQMPDILTTIFLGASFTNHYQVQKMGLSLVLYTGNKHYSQKQNVKPKLSCN